MAHRDLTWYEQAEADSVIAIVGQVLSQFKVPVTSWNKVLNVTAHCANTFGSGDVFGMPL